MEPAVFGSETARFQEPHGTGGSMCGLRIQKLGTGTGTAISVSVRFSVPGSVWSGLTVMYLTQSETSINTKIDFKHDHISWL